MNAPFTNVYLVGCLAPLSRYLGLDDITDIWINRPGEIWTEALGGRIERVEAPELTEALLMRLARQVAAVTAQGISREHPVLSASLPTGERIQIVMPPATRGHIAIAIRKHVISRFSLDDCRASGMFVGTRMIGDRGESGPVCIDPADTEPATLLRDAVRTRRNILISGGTSTGKTTFLNTLLREVPDHERLILIEDTPELQVRHDNTVGLLAARGAMGEASVTAEDLLIASLRMRPDRIILGEIRGAEAATFLRAVNTGHPGSLTTIHADSPTRAIDQLALLVLQTGIRMSWEDVVTYVRRSLDLIVQLERGPSGRAVAAILGGRNAV